MNVEDKPEHVVIPQDHPLFQLFLCVLGNLAMHDQGSALEYAMKAQAIMGIKSK